MKKLFWLMILSILTVSLCVAPACGDDDDDDNDDDDDDDDDDGDGLSAADCEGACAKAIDCIESEYYDLGVLRDIVESECVTMCEEDGTRDDIDCIEESSCETLLEDYCGLPIEDYMEDYM